MSTSEGVPPSSNNLHFLGDAAEAHRTPLFGDENHMPLPFALRLRTYFKISDGETISSVPLDQIEEQFKLRITGALLKAGFEVPPAFNWNALYTPALHQLATCVAQGVFCEINEVENRPPHSDLMLKTERLGMAIGLQLRAPDPQVFGPATIHTLTPHVPQKS